MADHLRIADLGKGGLRHQGLREALLSDISKARELPHGYAFLVSNSPATISTMIELLSLGDLPREYFRISQEGSSSESWVWVHVTGSHRIKEYLGNELVHE